MVSSYIYNLLFMVAKHKHKSKYKSTKKEKKMEERGGWEKREWVARVVYIILISCM